MLSAFEATVLGYVWRESCSRYKIMKTIQEQSLFWAGSPGAVYSAIERLIKKGYAEK